MVRQRMVVTGREGQVVMSLVERGAFSQRFDVLAVGRPSLDLSQPKTINAAIRQAQPDVVVSAAAYTAVDQAETDEDNATTINGTAAGAVAATAAALGVPVIHLSTDYVFDGTKGEPYLETDPVAPIGAYGRSKLAGELAVADAHGDHAILRTAWVYSPFGKNFLKTMLKLSETRDSVNVVQDQIGNPTSALDIADAVLAIAGNLIDDDDQKLRGVFHVAGAGEASWASFASKIFELSASRGGRHVTVQGVPSAAYPTVAKRPANSRLACGKLKDAHEVQLPQWTLSTAETISRLVGKEAGWGTSL
ncbi:MAG: dTDP-4-dehydrorhamnose reductase [Rhizobium oryzihabitans]